MFITICVIAYNEENTIDTLFECIRRQDYDHGSMEVLLVDSASTDSTRKKMEEFQSTENTFKRVVVLDNPKKTLPCGWNVALKEYSGEAIIKVDAHATIPEDFVSKNVRVLESGEYICGGQRPNIIDEPTPFKNTLLMAESSMFGSSIAPYRNNPGKVYVNSLFHGAYRREVFERTGLFNEKLARTEDNEIHYRMRQKGFKLCFDPEIISYQHTRSSLKSMLKQKYSNGYWIGLTAGVEPKCLSLYHFVPFAFVMAIILSAIVIGFYGFAVSFLSGSRILTNPVSSAFFNTVICLTDIMWVMYAILAVGMAVLAVVSNKESRNITCVFLPLLFLLLHVSYGVGTLRGFISLPGWKKKYYQ